MQYRNLGNSGLKVSRIGLGMMTYGSSKWRDWILNEKESRPFVKKALELGINFFDTADFYSLGISEEVTGRALKDFANRQDVVIATKVYMMTGENPNTGGLSRKHILQAVENSLRRLQTDYIDLYQIHRWDYDTPIEETMEALHDIVKSGKVRYIGASSMYAWQFCKAQYIADLHGWTRFISMQEHYNLIARDAEREMIPLCKDLNVGITPWSPLARGFLSGSRTRDKKSSTKREESDTYAHDHYYHENDFKVVDQVLKLAKQKNVSPSQIALAWLLNKPYITSPIIGASKINYLEEAVNALEIILTENEMFLLEEFSNLPPLKIFGINNEFRFLLPK